MKRAWLCAALLCAAALPALAQDYEREARWRAELVPNIVVGDAVDPRTADGRALVGSRSVSATGAAAASPRADQCRPSTCRAMPICPPC